MNVQDYVQQRAGEQGEDDKWRTQMAKQLARMQRAQDEQQARLAAALKAQAAALTSIMDKLNKPRGLVRYTTENELNGKSTHFMRPRLVGYAVMLTIMITAFTYAILTRTPFELDIERDRSSLYQLTVNDTIQNAYTLKMMNMSQKPQTFELYVDGQDGLTMDVTNVYDLKVNEMKEISLNLELDPEVTKLASSKANIEFVVVNTDTGEEVAREESRFIAPRT